jgi:hypothetical protein
MRDGDQIGRDVAQHVVKALLPADAVLKTAGEVTP